mgnify:CR=1 FL=1
MFQPVPPPTCFSISSIRSQVYLQPKTYVNPNALFGRNLFRLNLRRLGLQLGQYEGKHVLTAVEENLSGSVIRSRLFLVEAFKGILLGSLRITLMGLQERGVEE